MVSSEELAFLDEARAWLRSGGDIDALVLKIGNPLTRLWDAARHGYLSAIRWLLDHGADVKKVGTNTGSTPLHAAAYIGRCDAAVLLLDAGADVDARTYHSNTPLHHAAAAADNKLCNLLLSRGASLDARNENGRDPEARARKCGHPKNAAFLADVRAAGGWSAYVAAPRNQLLALRRDLPALRESGRASPSSVRLYERLFSEVPEEIFIHAVEFWRSERDA